MSRIPDQYSSPTIEDCFKLLQSIERRLYFLEARLCQESIPRQEIKLTWPEDLKGFFEEFGTRS